MVKQTAMFLVLAVILTGCWGGPHITHLVDVKAYEKPSQLSCKKILVVGKPIKEENRNQFETRFSAKLRKMRTDARPSHDYIPAMDDLNRDSIKEAAAQMAAGAVLATRVVGVDEKSVLIPQQMNVRMDPSPHGAGVGMTMTPFLEPAYVKDYTKVRLETGLFDVATEKMVWSASSIIVAPDSVKEAVRDFSKVIIERLSSDGYIE